MTFWAVSRVFLCCGTMEDLKLPPNVADPIHSWFTGHGCTNCTWSTMSDYLFKMKITFWSTDHFFDRCSTPHNVWQQLVMGHHMVCIVNTGTFLSRLGASQHGICTQSDYCFHKPCADGMGLRLHLKWSAYVVFITSRANLDYSPSPIGAGHLNHTKQQRVTALEQIIGITSEATLGNK